MGEIENLKIDGGATYTVGNEDIIANEWEASKTYVKGKSYVTYEHGLYVCNTTHTSVSPIDLTKWTAITVGEAIAANATAIGSLSTLTTTDKSSLVGAVNEVDGKIKNYSTTGAVAQICTIGSYYQSKIGHICSFEIEITLTSNAVFNTTIVSIPVIPKLTNVPILAYSPDLGSNVNLIIDLDGNIRAISNINSGIKLRIAGTILV